MTKHFWKKNNQQQNKIMVNYIAKGKEKRTALVLLLAKKKIRTSISSRDILVLSVTTF
jgi:hypothetical protein